MPPEIDPSRRTLPEAAHGPDADPTDFLTVASLPAPRVDAAWAERVLREDLGLAATARELGSNQDANFVVIGDDGEVLGVLRVANPAFPAEEALAQDAAADLVAERCSGLRVAQVVRRADGSPVRAVVDTPQGPATVRLLRLLDGGTLADRGYLSPRAVARLGEVAARVDLALAEIGDVPGVDRVLQWDPRYADRTVAALAGALPDDRRAQVERATAEAWAALEPLGPELPQQVVHLDLTDDNAVVGTDGWVDGVIDLGDLTRTWTVSEIAIAASSVLHHPGAEPASVLPALRAYHALRPLSAAEVDAVWPLVVLRAAVLVVSGAHQQALDGDNDYVGSRLAREWRILDQALSVPLEVMTGVVRHALGVPAAPGPATGEPLVRLSEGTVVLDLSSTSPDLDEGAWRDPDVVERIARDRLEAGAPAVVTRYAEARLAGTTGPTQEVPATVATGIDVWTAEPVELPDLGVGDRDDVVVTGSGTRFRVTAGPLAGIAPDAVAAAYAPGWLAGLRDPAPLLGLEPTPPERDDDVLARRERALAEVQEHYYREPPRIERGWRHHLVTDTGRPLLDVINNVAILGHSHPAVAAVAERQLRLLNTNSRFHYEAIAEFAARLAELAPDPLDTVFLVNSGSEAADLAIRLAMVSTGREDVVAMAEAYHGWTYASDAVSTSVADNPNALETRPDWVHTVPAANPYRGRHRGADAQFYGSEAAALIDELAASGRPPAAFVAEAYYGNAGGMPLPDGYLEQVYAAVRRHGGLAVADEIQVGYGRLGRWFWGFEQQGVVPDVVAVAKGVGNGCPVGAVITTRAVADAYRGAGYFFSSTGGSPLSSRIGVAVLDALRDEGLQANARDVGDHLARRLRELVDRHELVGAVHGHGLYLGVELVRDRDTLEPAPEETAAICDRLLELGVVVQPTSDRQNVLKVKPPLCLDREAADFFVDALDRVLAEGW